MEEDDVFLIQESNNIVSILVRKGFVYLYDGKNIIKVEKYISCNIQLKSDTCVTKPYYEMGRICGIKDLGFREHINKKDVEAITEFFFTNLPSKYKNVEKILSVVYTLACAIQKDNEKLEKLFKKIEVFINTRLHWPQSKNFFAMIDEYSHVTGYTPYFTRFSKQYQKFFIFDSSRSLNRIDQMLYVYTFVREKELNLKRSLTEKEYAHVKERSVGIDKRRRVFENTKKNIQIKLYKECKSRLVYYQYLALCNRMNSLEIESKFIEFLEEKTKRKISEFKTPNSYFGIKKKKLKRISSTNIDSCEFLPRDCCSMSIHPAVINTFYNPLTTFVEFGKVGDSIKKKEKKKKKKRRKKKKKNFLLDKSVKKKILSYL